MNVWTMRMLSAARVQDGTCCCWWNGLIHLCFLIRIFLQHQQLQQRQSAAARHAGRRGVGEWGKSPP